MRQKMCKKQGYGWVVDHWVLDHVTRVNSQASDVTHDCLQKAQTEIQKGSIKPLTAL